MNSQCAEVRLSFAEAQVTITMSVLCTKECRFLGKELREYRLWPRPTTQFLTHKYAQLIAYYAFLRTQIEANQRGVADQVKFHCHVAGIHVARRHQTHKQRDINSI